MVGGNDETRREEPPRKGEKSRRCTMPTHPILLTIPPRLWPRKHKTTIARSTQCRPSSHTPLSPLTLNPAPVSVPAAATARSIVPKGRQQPRGVRKRPWVSTASRSRSAHLEAWREVEAEIGKWDRWARRMIGRWVNG